eukprot:scaffold142024_cov33-Cyclotella_meneghiniana.AAC.3
MSRARPEQPLHHSMAGLHVCHQYHRLDGRHDITSQSRRVLNIKSTQISLIPQSSRIALTMKFNTAAVITLLISASSVAASLPVVNLNLLTA